MSKCSIVIPVHNKAGVTKACLSTLFADPPEVDFEVIVVDDGSTDGTLEVLKEFRDTIAVVQQKQSGFAVASNRGAAAATGDFLLFLNNDTKPVPGWLDSMVSYARSTEAGVVGAKLLFEDASIQHAGVVICADGKPRHIYAGFPADHPAVNQSRRFQAVTAACVLLERAAFEEVGGFDAEYQNGLEDVDLFLRLGEKGYETHYCHEAVLFHLESVSRGRDSKQIERNGKLFRERWDGKIRADEFDYYIADGLLKLDRRDAYPLRFRVAPELGAISTDGAAARHGLDQRAGQVLDLLREIVRLTAFIADKEVGSTAQTATSFSPSATGRDALLDEARMLESLIFDFQTRVAAAADGFESSKYLSYRKLVNGIRETVEATVPPNSTVLVITRGDPDLLRLGDRSGWHFPQMDDGTYAGHYPPSTQAVVDHVQALRASGADHLVIPTTALWWLEHYVGLRETLDESFELVHSDRDPCLVYSLSPSR